MHSALELQLAIDQGKVADRDLAFARDLIRAASTWGATEKQSYWIDKLVKRANGTEQPDPAKVKPEPRKVGDMRDMLAMFAKAKENGLKSPKIRLQGFTLSLAKETSANAGSVYVKSLDGLYCGKINPQGEYRAAFNIGDVANQAFAAVIAFAADPSNRATAYGHLTNSCCFCGITLRDAESVRLGYGPICAKNWGLAHNAAGKATRIDVNRSLEVSVS